MCNPLLNCLFVGALVLIGAFALGLVVGVFIGSRVTRPIRKIVGVDIAFAPPHDI